jgi:hypothetical protein
MIVLIAQLRRIELGIIDFGDITVFAHGRSHRHWGEMNVSIEPQTGATEKL